MIEQLNVVTNVTIDIWDRTGSLRGQRKARNLLGERGRLALQNALAGPGGAIGGGGHINRTLSGTGKYLPKIMAFGIDDTLPTDNQTAMGSEKLRKAILRRSAREQLAGLQSIILFSEANGNNLTEAGLFASTFLTPTATDTDEYMWARVIFNGIEKTNEIELTITWDINIL